MIESSFLLLLLLFYIVYYLFGEYSNFFDDEVCSFFVLDAYFNRRCCFFWAEFWKACAFILYYWIRSWRFSSSLRLLSSYSRIIRYYSYTLSKLRGGTISFFMEEVSSKP